MMMAACAIDGKIRIDAGHTGNSQAFAQGHQGSVGKICGKIPVFIQQGTDTRHVRYRFRINGKGMLRPAEKILLRPMGEIQHVHHSVMTGRLVSIAPRTSRTKVTARSWNLSSPSNRAIREPLSTTMFGMDTLPNQHLASLATVGFAACAASEKGLPQLVGGRLPRVPITFFPDGIADKRGDAVFSNLKMILK